MSFCLDSVILSLILKQMYEKDDYGKFIKRISTYQAELIVGTPGIGKTIKYFALKVLHDLRIPHIIKNGG